MGRLVFQTEKDQKMQILELRIPMIKREREREEKLYHCERKKNNGK
jgi:hypothetical protein